MFLYYAQVRRCVNRRILALDQSFSNCAVVVFECNSNEKMEIIHKEVIKTGSDSSKAKKRSDTVYFPTKIEQLYFIIIKLLGIVHHYKIDKFVMESLSFSSVGNQTRDLAGLFFTLQFALIFRGFNLDNIHTLAPTAIKSWARNVLPEEEREAISETGKKTKVKMDKKMMVKAVDILYPTELDNYTVVSGKQDLADAIIIGSYFHEMFNNNA